MSGYLLGTAMVLLLVLQSSQCVDIKYQGFQVKLESVKELSALEEQQVSSLHLQDKNLQPPVCHHPALPQDLQPICASENAASLLKGLRTIATDDCELCVNVACTGCL
uniref:Guanylate cyclase activator 2B n=2 Tax=Jaculus jaculus TaxID=51337 RepID=A0A8C5K7P5_JACJA